MEAKHVDLSYLMELSGKDNKLIIEMIEIFNSEVPVYLRLMDEYLKKQDWTSLGRLAHKARASASIMGVGRLADELRELELLAAEHKEPERYQPLTISISNQFNSAIEELKLVSETL